MKTKPNVGDRVVWYAYDTGRMVSRVNRVDGNAVLTDSGHWVHYRNIRRLVKRKKKCEECADLKAKLAKYESAEKYWVRIPDPERGKLSVPSSWLYINRSELTVDLDSHHWQVAVIDKKKASEA